MINIPNISNGEWQIIKVLWNKSPLTAASIVSEIQKNKNCSPRTIKTLLRRLIAKGAVVYTVDDKDSRIYHYSPTITEGDCLHKVNEEFLKIHYSGDFSNMIQTFIDQYGLTEKTKGYLKEKLN